MLRNLKFYLMAYLTKVRTGKRYVSGWRRTLVQINTHSVLPYMHFFLLIAELLLLCPRKSIWAVS